MASITEQAEIVLLVTAIVGMLARRLRIPTTAGLVVAGLGLALVPGTIDITLTKELIFDAFLPPLVFEAALYINWNELRKDSAVILTMATLGVLLTAGVTTAGGTASFSSLELGRRRLVWNIDRRDGSCFGDRDVQGDRGAQPVATFARSGKPF